MGPKKQLLTELKLTQLQIDELIFAATTLSEINFVILALEQEQIDELFESFLK